LLILVCLALGALVFLDNKPASVPQSQPPPPPLSHQPTSERDSQDHETPVSATRTDQVVIDESQLGNPLADFDKAKLKDTVERPLFSSSRRRPPPGEKVVKRPIKQVAPKPQPPSYDLLGVVRRGDRAIALLRKRSDGTSFRVEVGDMIGGWRVSKMEPTSVLLERDDGTSQIVPLF
jgi:general secretion pathway protein N